jgi:integrase
MSYGIAHLPVAEFATTVHLRPWLRAMRAAGTGPQVEKRAWAVLSAALSWGVEQDDYTLEANGCSLMQRGRAQRRASRRGGTGWLAAKLTGKRRTDLENWALSPQAAERIRAAMLDRTGRRPRILALRDATVVSVQYQLACRNQEVWGLRIEDVRGSRAQVVEVLSFGELDTGKTPGSSGRRPPIRGPLRDDLDRWIGALDDAGYPTNPEAFLFPGSLSGPKHGHPLGHMTNSQAKKWGPSFFNPAADLVAERWPKLKRVRGATPYALRRGGISLRLRAGEDPQQVAEECGTSTAMLERHYNFVLEDLRDHGPRPVEEEVRAARVLVFRGHPRPAA